MQQYFNVDIQAKGCLASSDNLNACHVDTGVVKLLWFHVFAAA